MGFFRNDNDDDEYRGQTGDPFRDAVNGWDMGSNPTSNDNYIIEPDEPSIDTSKRDEYSKKAWDYYMDFREEDALRYINLALELDNDNSRNWNKKAIILEALKRYPESEECYDKSLELAFDNLVSDNEIRMLYDWAYVLIDESKTLPNGLNKLEKAKEINKKALETRPGINSEESIDKYLDQRDAINRHISNEREYLKNLETLKSIEKSELFTIAGTYYHNNIDITPGMPLKLVKEPENEFDRDAIAVYAGDVKIGYVANSASTKHELTSSSSELKDNIHDTAQAICLFNLQRHSDAQFLIGKIIE